MVPEEEFILGDYGKYLHQKKLAALDEITGNLFRELIWRLPPFTIVVAVDRDSPNVHLFKIPEFLGRDSMGDIPYIHRNDIPNVIHLFECYAISFPDPTHKFYFKSRSGAKIDFYGAQIPSLQDALECARTYHGPLRYFAVPFKL
mgnify:CR=1 FL=1